jgi:CheY-like chemotaxis protein
MAKTILIAEDSDDEADLLRLALKDAGIKNPVARVRDGDEVITWLKGEGLFADRMKFPLPEVLFLDVKMPRKSGFHVLEWLIDKPEFNDLLVVVLTGFDQTKDVQQSYMLGADTFLSKPCKPADIQHLARMFAGYWQTSP